jgi:hypothetical protein
MAKGRPSETSLLGLDFLVLFSQVGAKRRSAGFFGGTKVTMKKQSLFYTGKTGKIHEIQV